MKKKEMYELLIKCEQEVSKIFNELVDKTNNISPYNLISLAKDINHIEFKIDEIINTKNDTNKANEKKNFYKEIIQYIIYLLLTFFIFFAAPWLFPLILLFVFKKKEKPVKIEEDFNNEIFYLVKKLNIELENCHTFINHRKKQIYPDEKKLPLFTEFDYANFAINYFLENPNITTNELNNIHDNIKINMIKILQDDLNTDINNIEVLIICARSQILKKDKEMSQDYIRTRKKC